MSTDRRAPRPGDEPPPETNAEWRLVDLLASLDEEADEALDRVRIAGTAKGSALAVQNLKLALAVNSRVDEDGQIYYRTLAPGETSETILELELGPLFRSQIAELDASTGGNSTCGLPIAALPGATAEEVSALGEMGLRTLADLEPLAASPELLARLTLRSGVAEWKLRDWLGLPYLQSYKSEGPRLVVRGGNFGERDAEALLVFWNRPSPIDDWSEDRLATRIPSGARGGPVYAVVQGRCTNSLEWSPIAPRPAPDL